MKSLEDEDGGGGGTLALKYVSMKEQCQYECRSIDLYAADVRRLRRDRRNRQITTSHTYITCVPALEFSPRQSCQNGKPPRATLLLTTFFPFVCPLVFIMQRTCIIHHYMSLLCKINIFTSYESSATRNIIYYKKHREIETTPHFIMRFLFSFSKISQKCLVVSYNGLCVKIIISIKLARHVPK